MCGVRFLLVHGTTQSAEGWRLLINELNDAGHAAVTTDLARFGDRLSTAEYGHAVAAEWSGTTVDVVVAHSGSGLLLRRSRRRPRPGCKSILWRAYPTAPGA